MVGKLHKKKISEYTDAAENDDTHLNDKSDDEVGDEGMVDKEDLVSASESETGDVAKNKKNKSTESAEAVDDEEEDDEVVNNDEGDEDAKGRHEESNEDDADEALVADDEDVGDSEEDDGAAKKTKKRKAAEKSPVTKKDGAESEEEPMNGVTPKKRGRKPAAKTGTGKAGKQAAPKAKPKKVKKPAAVELDDDVEEDDDEEEEYEVKDIVGHKTERGVSYFLIRWKGYSKGDDTWEAENTLSCPEIIEKYKKKNIAVTPKKGGSTPAKKGAKSPAAKKSIGKKVDNEKEWEVEKIIDYAEEKKGRVFRIRWKGFGAKHDTWEPEENLSCSDIIEKFLKRMKTQENLSFKELREEPKKTKRLMNETLPRTNLTNRIGRTSKRSVTKKRTPSPIPTTAAAIPKAVPTPIPTSIQTPTPTLRSSGVKKNAAEVFANFENCRAPAADRFTAIGEVFAGHLRQLHTNDAINLESRLFKVLYDFLGSRKFP